MSYSGAYFSSRMLFIQKFRCSILWPAFVIGNRNISIFNGRSDRNELSDRMYMRKNSQSQTRWEQLAPKFTVEKFNHEKRNQSGIGFRFLDGIWSEKKIGLLSSQGCHLLFGRICVCNVPTNRRSIQLVLRMEFFLLWRWHVEPFFLRWKWKIWKNRFQIIASIPHVRQATIAATG